MLSTINISRCVYIALISNADFYGIVMVPQHIVGTPDIQV